MEITTPISNIIKPIDKKDFSSKLTGNETLNLAFNPKSLKVQKKAGGIKSFLRMEHLEYYQVDFDKRTRVEVNDITIASLKDNISIDFKVICDLQFIQSSLFEDQIQGFLQESMQHENMFMTVDRIIRKSFVSTAIDKIGAVQFISEFYNSGKEQVLSELERVLKKYGFRADILIQPKNDDTIVSRKQLSLKGHVPIRVSDYDSIINLKYVGEASIRKDTQIFSLTGVDTPGSIAELVNSTLREIAKEYSLNGFIKKLNTELKDTAITATNESIRRLGYKINFLTLEYSQKEIGVFKPLELTMPVNCTIRNFDEKIEVDNKLLVHVEDYAAYLGAKIQDPKSWIKSMLTDICMTHLFDKSYLDIIFDKENSEEERIEFKIKKDLVIRAKEKGLRIDQHFILPVLQPLLLKEEGINIDIPKEYATKNSEIKISVQLLLTGRIENLRIVEKYIERQVDIQKEIEKIACRTIEREMHKIGAERALLFNVPPEGDPDQTTCEDILIEAIKKALEPFGIDPFDLTLKADESDLKTRLADYMRGTHSFSIDIYPHISDENAEVVEFEIEYKIRGVDPNMWYVFHNDRNKDHGTQKELEAIQSTIQRDLESKLPMLPIEMLRFTDYKTAQDIQKKIVQPVTKKIATTYGVIIEFINMARKNTNWENTMLGLSDHQTAIFSDNRKKALEITTAGRLDEVTELQKFRMQLVKDNEDGENDEKIERLDKQISAINDDLPSLSMKKQLALKKEVKTPLSDFSMDVFLEQPAEDNPIKIEEGQQSDDNAETGNSETDE